MTDPVDEVRGAYDHIAALDDLAVVVSVVETSVALGRAAALAQSSPGGALSGVPVLVKDNVAVAGIPTGAGCPAFGRGDATASAAVVELLEAAGAVVIGTTNMDQFATGLVGTRSPYGTPRNPCAPAHIPGGSSSGAGVAVARGLVPLAIGTDTAGSGRVPAACTNTVGCKPTAGLISTAGIVPAIPGLDCVSIHTRTVAEAWTALAALAPGAGSGGPRGDAVRIGRVPRAVIEAECEPAVPRRVRAHVRDPRRGSRDRHGALLRGRRAAVRRRSSRRGPRRSARSSQTTPTRSIRSSRPSWPAATT